MTEEQQQIIRQIVRNEMQEFFASDRYIFHKTIQLLEGRDFQFATGTGSKIGTATSQKIGFWNKTPIVQPASADQAALSLTANVSGGDTVSLTNVNNNFSKIQTLVNQLRTDLVNAGIIKGEA